MTLFTYALPIATALLLVFFLSALPPLKSCQLPHGADRAPDHVDWALIALISLVYAAVAFARLGDRSDPETFVPLEGQTATLTLDEPAQPASAMLYSGVGMGNYDLQVSYDGAEFITVHRIEQGSADVLKWRTFSLYDVSEAIVSLRVTGAAGTPWLGEVVLLDADGGVLPLHSEVSALCDEAETVPEKQTYMNSTYFDEIYHARTAWEHLHGVWPYEISHPPLGKEILSLGILLFGMTPFGWRFSGTLFGVLMLPVMYLLLRRLFGGKAVPALGTVVFASDFMHFVQTRIATIDTYAVFFILLMYLFMLIWLQEGKNTSLALCGLSFGLGAASKWTCLYAGAGLGVLWAAHWVLSFLPLSRGKQSDSSPSALLPRFLKNAGFCLIFFVALPCLIYYLSYLPYGAAQGYSPLSRDYLRIVLENQRFMFTYHSSLVATHPYSSTWYQWLLNIRPILYYLDYLPDGTRVSICALLSPALCWGGFLSLFVLFYTAIFRRDKTAAFILVGYLAQLLPWVFITRLTFAYHYFPASVFLVLALGYVFTLLRDGSRHGIWYAAGFACVSVCLFVLFYPALAGTPVDNLLGSRLLQWLPTWPL